MEWLKKLGAAIRYIEDNLDKEISYEEAARIACCSTYDRKSRDRQPLNCSGQTAK